MAKKEAREETEKIKSKMNITEENVEPPNKSSERIIKHKETLYILLNDEDLTKRQAEYLYICYMKRRNYMFSP